MGDDQAETSLFKDHITVVRDKGPLEKLYTHDYTPSVIVQVRCKAIDMRTQYIRLDTDLSVYQLMWQWKIATRSTQKVH